MKPSPLFFRLGGRRTVGRLLQATQKTLSSLIEWFVERRESEGEEGEEGEEWRG